MPDFDQGQAHPARMYDYLLGGRDNLEPDRAAIAGLLQAVPSARTGARENRAFLGRAVRYLVAEAGIRQFLDIGSGFPTANNVHEVAQSIDPASRVVYVDNDPLVLARARELLAGQPPGQTAFIQADLRDPAAILYHPVLRETLDLTQPVALMLVAVLHFFPDEADPAGIVAHLLAALAPGSFLVASHTTADFATDTGAAAGGVQAVHQAGLPFQVRTAAEFTGLAFGGPRLADPGLVPVSEWRPDDGPRPRPAEVGYYGAVGRKGY